MLSIHAFAWAERCGSWWGVSIQNLMKQPISLLAWLFVMSPRPGWMKFQLWPVERMLLPWQNIQKPSNLVIEWSVNDHYLWASGYYWHSSGMVVFSNIVYWTMRSSASIVTVLKIETEECAFANESHENQGIQFSIIVSGWLRLPEILDTLFLVIQSPWNCLQKTLL